MRPSLDRDVRYAWPLLLSAVVFWGLNWPIMKIGVGHVTPLWFSCLRILLGAATMFLVVAAQGSLALPKRADLPIVFSVGSLQLGISMALMHTAVGFVEAGRSSILAYTTPIWALPLAFVFLRERPNRRRMAGLALGVAGLMLLFNPLAFTWRWDDYAFGNVLLLASALAWAVTIVHLRGHKWVRPLLVLLPWQLLVGGVVLLGVALAVEGPPDIDLSPSLIGILFFNGVVASAYCFWAFNSAAQALPANTTALASLGVPVVGVASGAIILGESVPWSTALGLGLILAGIGLSSTRTKGAAA